MAVLDRVSLINEAKYRAGVDSTAVNLVTEYDQVTRDITGRHDLLRGNYSTGNLVNSDTYNFLLVSTLDFKSVDHMKVDATARSEVVPLDPDIFWSYPITFVAGGIPTKVTYNPADGRLWLNPFPSSMGPVAYYLWYTKYHPKATGDTYCHVLGEEFDEVITYGLAAYACEIVKTFEKANYFRLVYEEILKTCAEVRRKRMIRYEFPER